MSVTDLKKKAVGGVAWSSVGNLGSHLIQFMTTLALARILTPNDFGLVAMANTYTVLVNTINDFGVSSSLIHRQDVDERHLSTSFWINSCIGISLTLGTCVLAGSIAKFYSNALLGPVLIALSTVFFINSTKTVQTAVLIRNLRYNKIAIAGLIEMLSNGLVTILLAYRGCGVWSIVHGRIFGVVIGRLYILFVSEWSPIFLFDFNSFKELFSFGVNAMAGNFIGYFILTLDNIILGHYGGSAALGVYSMAYNISMMPQKKISSVVSWVAFPLLSKIQDDKQRVANAYFRLINMVSFVTFPILGGIFSISPEFVSIVLGKNWSAVQVPLQILCVAGMVMSVSATSGSVLYSLGRPDIEMKLGLLSVIMLYLALFFGVRFGLLGVSMAVTAQYSLLSLIYAITISRFLDTVPLKMYRIVALNFMHTAIMVLAVIFFKSTVNRYGLHQVETLCFSVMFGACTYLAISFLFNRDLFCELLDISGCRKLRGAVTAG